MEVMIHIGLTTYPIFFCIEIDDPQVTPQTEGGEADLAACWTRDLSSLIGPQGSVESHEYVIFSSHNLI